MVQGRLQRCSLEPGADGQKPGGEMRAQMAYPLQVMDSFAVEQLPLPQPGKYVADFGQNASGIIRLKVKVLKAPLYVSRPPNRSTTTACLTRRRA